jgi:endonuclease III-like uncharacterized protein
MINKTALNYLKKCHDNITEVPQDVRSKAWVGESASKWFQSINVDWKPSTLSKEPLDRHQLLKYIEKLTSDKPISNAALRACIIEIFAWGGKRFHKQKTLSSLSSFEQICRDLVENKINSVEAYDRFYIASISGGMKGLGPAYYTKLICFLGDQTGLVMDQWTARSVNKLFDSEIVKLDAKKVVSPKNNSDNYAKFLQGVGILQNRLSLNSLMETEELIFSCSYKKNKLGKDVRPTHHLALSAWRKFVDSNQEI